MRHSNTYHLKGSSVLESIPPVFSENYHFKFWTPARQVFSINHLFTSKLGVIGTIQRIQWSIFKKVAIYGAAAQMADGPTIIPKAVVPYFLKDSWLLTVGSHYRPMTQCVVRIAATYNESPEKGRYHISNGNSLFLGGSIGYELKKNITIDAGYAHGFFKNADIHITSGTRQVEGINRASRDAVSLKFTINI